MQSFRRVMDVCLLVLCAIGAVAQDTGKPAPDVLIFNNGDQLTGKFERVADGHVVFKSEMAGEISVGFDKVKELRSSSDFVALRKDAKKAPIATTGAVQVEAGNIVVTPENGAAETIPSGDIAFLIDRSTYEKEVGHQPGFTHGWNGAVTGGASLVRSTQNATSLTAGVSLIRAIPTVPYLPARNRTTLDVVESYGRQTSPVIPPTNPPLAAVVVVSSIFHADAERDEYFSPRLFALADVSFDHNYAQGLQLQQVYGGGVGWTARKTNTQELDFKADVHFEKQAYFSATPGVAATRSVNLFGTTLSEMYHRALPRKLVFTQSLNYLPAWTEMHDYSANLNAALAMPVVKRLSASVAVTDSYLNDPAMYYKRNSFQFVTGVTYTLR